MKLAGVSSSERRREADRLLDVVRLTAFAGRQPHELSGGMRQRVALARALAQRSRIMLMDEPFGALDAITRDLLHDELERVWQDTGLSVVFVTHDVREAVRLADRIVLMSSRPGRIVHEVSIPLERPRDMASHAAVSLIADITASLRSEVRRHAPTDGSAAAGMPE
jgi:NitT/TauT family transport system ATP-binding protein